MLTNLGAHDALPKLLAILSSLLAEMHAGSVAPEVHADSHLERDLGLDSLARAELLSRLSEEFAVVFPDSTLAEAETPLDLIKLLEARFPASALEAPPLPALQRFSQGTPDQANSLIEVLEWHAKTHPEQTHALLYETGEIGQTISYGELHREALRVASGLLLRGLGNRQTVALMLPSGRAYLTTFFGVMLAGGIPVPIYPPARLNQLEEHLKRHARILDNAQTVLIVTVAQAKGIAGLLKNAVPSLDEIVTPDELDSQPLAMTYRPTPGDIAFLQYTSGSTGTPKGVVLTHANLLANLRAMGRATHSNNQDVFVSWLPLYHDMGLIGAWFGSLYFGMLLVLMTPLSFLTRPARWLEAITKHRGTISAAPNFAFELCTKKISDHDLSKLDLSSWRLALSGAEPVIPETIEAFSKRFSPCGLRREAITPVYGLAESSVGLSFPPPGRGPLIERLKRERFTLEKLAQPAGADEDSVVRIASCGYPLAQHEIRIVNDAGDELPERFIGRLQFRGPSATSGYYRNPEATKNLFQDGWLDSGDCAYSAAGEIYLTGRVKDLIIRAGHNIYPYELEQMVGDIPGIRKGCVAAFGSLDIKNATERLVIVAETREADLTRRAALHRQINEVALNMLGTPADDIVLLSPNALLKTSSGKIRRAASRDAYEQGLLDKPGLPWWQERIKLGYALSLNRLSAGWQRSRRLLFSGWCWLLLTSIGLPTALIVATLQKPAIARHLVHLAARVLFRLAGIPVHQSGLVPWSKNARLLLVNHSSYLDVLILYATLPPALGYSFVAKSELARQGFAHAFLRGLGTLFVDRFTATQSIKDVEKMIDALVNGARLVIFPEGTFTRQAGLSTFHMGAFIAASHAGVAIQTAGLRGSREALRDGTWLLRRTRLELEIGPTTTPSGKDWRSAVELRNMAREQLLKLCGEHDLAQQSGAIPHP